MINMISLAWNQAKSEIIKNCFIEGEFPASKLNNYDLNDKNDVNERIMKL